ncbi:winged helix-turn-helix transcriptional regulator [Nocardia seriolae]|uniref:HxlR family transcriptional regulator n=1 Tax=Nocardia seriolae TaxID=37332 RepID=A0A0B8NGY6_9NOCA|nr:helix-turn-helix domain-containing protein [Nocardia seriolae]MTJ65999.1 transcriptional regulator [Nocardia seriolae]MTJ75643.1 transcriptional regulator [Nocardia seriolae]MTJ86077.1 transcriptional regulator [Nocardia seriolae]MTK30072.1 transcriptional regulator [Nocardia seriolae]MTK43999.1 transcriptional regulator [Nocardia seriolae]
MRRFDAIQEATGASRAILVARLRGLTQAGVLERVEYREPGARTRHEYRLTPAGRELQPVLTALMQWGDKHLASPAGPPLTVTHTDCGATVRATLRCEHGHVLPDTGRDLTVHHNREPKRHYRRPRISPASGMGPGFPLDCRRNSLAGFCD